MAKSIQGQLSMFEETTSADSLKCISFAGLLSGRMRCVVLAGTMGAKSGRALALVSRSAQQEKAQAKKMQRGTFGLSGFGSSASAALQSSLVSKLAPRLATAGSTMFSYRWNRLTTPAGRSYFQLAASGRHIGESGFILPQSAWITPQTHDDRERGNTEADHHYSPHDLSNQALLSPWPTATKEDARSSRRQEGYMVTGHSGTTLTDAANLSPWPSPAAQEFEGGNEKMLERREREKAKGRNGNGFGLTLGMASQLAAWPTPRTPTGGPESAERKQELGRTESGDGDLQAVAQMASWATPSLMDVKNPNPRVLREGAAAHDNCSRQARLTAFGPTPNGSPAPTERQDPQGEESTRSSGQLNPSLSKWLMGIPMEWDVCAILAYRRMKAAKRRK